MELIKTGYVYKLVSKDITITECYVGSTNNMRIRKSNHKSKCNNEVSKHYNFRVYQYIRANGGFKNWDLIVIETVQYDQKHELHARERYHLELLGATLNSNVPNRTDAEYREDHKEHIKQYYQDNKEHIKQYYENNKEHIKQYYENNAAQLNQKHDCPCGGRYTQQNKTQHEKTAKHQRHVAL